MREILVVPRDKLFVNDAFYGLNTSVDFQSRIRKYAHYLERTKAEVDPLFKQPIPYVVVLDEKTQRVFAYRRQGNEKRLHDLWSIGIGGHIDREDAGENPLHAAMRRELIEEIGITPKTFEVLGYLNDDTNEVGKVHFGVLNIMRTNEQVRQTDKEIQEGTYLSIDELEALEIQGLLESWSVFALPAIKEYVFKRLSYVSDK